MKLSLNGHSCSIPTLARGLALSLAYATGCILLSGTAQAEEGDIGRLTKMEIRYFGAESAHTFGQRLDRLEQMIFGQPASGALQERMQHLEKALGTNTGTNSSDTNNSGTEIAGTDISGTDLSGSKSSDATSLASDSSAADANKSKPLASISSSKANTSSTIATSSTMAAALPIPTTRTARLREKSTTSSITQPKESFDSLSQKAVKDYTSQRFHAAADDLMAALHYNHTDARTYYRLGDVLSKLQDSEGAKEAYQAAFKMDPFGEVGALAKQQIMGTAQQEAYQASVPQDTQKVVANTISTINRQSADLAARYSREARNWQQWRSQLASIEAQKIQRETQLAQLGFRTARGSSFGGGYGHNYYARGYGNGRGYGTDYSAYQYDGQEISNIGQIRSNYVRSDGRVQGNNARIEASIKAANVAESAANLKDLMLQSTRPGDARLRALGTNLYVRYYGNDTPSSDQSVPEDALEELRAKTLKLAAH